MSTDIVRYSKVVSLNQNGHRFSCNPTTKVFVSEFGDDKILSFHNLFSCGYCDAYPGGDSFKLTGDTAAFSTPCPVAGGITTVITLTVNSGKIVIDDDLRPIYDSNKDVEVSKFASYNSYLGQHQVMLAYAKQGCAYGPVGNSSPSLYRAGKDSYVIANPGYDEDKDEENVPSNWKFLANVCTDLWAYSIADYEDFLSKGGQKIEGNNQYGTRSVIDFPNGVYEFAFHGNERDFEENWSEATIHTNIRKIS